MNIARTHADSSDGWGAVPASDWPGRTPPLLEARLAPRGAGIGFGLLAVLVHDSPLGVLVVDASLRVAFANPMGQAILEQDDGLGLVAGVLHERENRLLEPRLQRLLRGDNDAAADADAPFHLPRRSGRRPYEITLRAPSLQDASRGTTLNHVCVYVRDPDVGVPIDEASLRARYGLTPAEARTAVALTMGGTLPEHSELLKLKPMTIRGYVKQIFAKTATHSQLDLLRLVLTGAKSLAVDLRRPAREPD